MATIVGNPGFSAYKRGALIRALTAVGATVVFSFAVVGASYAFGSFGLYALLVVIVILAAEIYYFRGDYADLLGLWGEGGNWWKGADGERALSGELRRLPAEYIVFNDFHPIGKDGQRAAWNVDHIVIGPGGVFVLDAKNYSAQRVLSAARSTFSRKNVKQASRNAVELKKKLSAWSAGALEAVFVVPIVVYVQPGAQLESSREGAARVATLLTVNGLIGGHTENALDMEKVIRIATVLRSQVPTNDWIPFEEDFQDYCRLAREEVRRERLAAPPAVAAQPIASDLASVSIARPARVCPKCGSELVVRTARREGTRGTPSSRAPGTRVAGTRSRSGLSGNAARAVTPWGR